MALLQASNDLVRVISGVDWLKILRGVLHWLDHLHSKHKVTHSDIKYNNIVPDKKGASIEMILG